MASLDDILTAQKNGVVAINRIGLYLQQLSGNAYVAGNLADLKALIAPYPPAVITECRASPGDQGGGTWVFQTGDQSANVAADPQNGIWAAPNSDTTGASGAWQRQYDGPLDPRWFGAKCDGTTDDTAALNAAMAVLSPSGGTVLLPGTTRCTSANVVIPARVTLDLGLDAVEITANTDTSYTTWQHLSLSSSHTIRLYGRIQNGLILRDGMTFPAANSLAFAGTAITASADGATTQDLMVLGFASLFLSDGWARICLGGKFYGDATAVPTDVAIKLQNSYDTTIVENVHLWPFASVGYNSGSPPTSALIRPGIGLQTSGQSDDTTISKALVLGYGINFEFASNGNITCGQLWSDHVTLTNSDIGIKFTNNVNKVAISVAFAYSSSSPVYFDHGNGIVTISTLVAAFSQYNCVNILTGNVYVAEAHINNADSYAIACANSAVPYQVRFANGIAYSCGASTGGVYFAVPSGATPGKLSIGLQTDQGAGTSKYGANILLWDSIASAATLLLPVNSDTIEVTGTTNITQINGVWGTRRITLRFTAALTVVNGGNLQLAGGVNFVTVAGSMIEFIYDATAGVWRETWRVSP